jgi:hypothetical protein
MSKKVSEMPEPFPQTNRRPRMSRSDKSVAQTQGVGQKGTRRCKQKDKKLIMMIAVVMVLGVCMKLRV